MWKCCGHDDIPKKMNFIYFWEKMKSADINENIPFKLINEKTLYLEDGFDSILTIGINPQAQFAIGARLEIRSTNNILYLKEDTLLRLLECINERFNESAVFPDVLTKPDSESDGSISIKLTSFYEQFYKITIGEDRIKMKQITLISLLKKRTFIRLSTQYLELKRKKYEITFFRLLNHFCSPKTVEEAIQLSKLIYTHNFFEEIYNFHCDCIEKPFILEIAFNFMDWFINCIPIFIDTIMLDEKKRHRSFSNGWPHEKLYMNINHLAKTGFYYTGVNDCVKCVFCGIDIHSWESSDNIIHEHYKFSPHCKFLNAPEKTDNIFEGSRKELNHLMTEFYKFKGFDEVDSI